MITKQAQQTKGKKQLKPKQLVGNLTLASSLVFSVLLSVPSAMADHNLDVYHEKLLAYQVQPGRFEANRKEVCEKLKAMTRAKVNVDDLWAKFDGLERRAGLRDIKDQGYFRDCNAFISEVNVRLVQFNKEGAAGAEAASKAAMADAKEKRDVAYAAYIDNAVKTWGANPGPHLKRRQRIWDEIKRCHAMKKNVASHVEHFKQMDRDLAQGKDVTEQCRQLEYSLALPDTIRD